MEQSSWDDVRLFLALVRGGSMRAAAQALEVSHSTVARRMEQLERRAGTQLVARVDGALTLSDAGQDLLAVAERMEGELQALERRSFGRDHALSGPLVLAILDALMVPPVLALLAAFRAKHPQVALELKVGMDLSDLERREADLALRFGNSPSDALVGRRIAETGRAVYGAASYVAAHWPDPVAQGAGWIGFTPVGQAETWKRKTGFAALPTHYRMADMRSQVTAMKAGMGISLLPCFLCDPDPDLRRISAVDFPSYQQLWLLRHADARNNARLKALSDHLYDGFRGLEPLLRGQTQSQFDPSELSANSGG